MQSSKGREHPDIPLELEAALREYYAPWNKLLFGALDRKFDWNNRVIGGEDEEEEEEEDDSVAK